MYIIWAYGDGDIISDNNFGKHSSRGVGPDKLVIIPEAPVPSQPGAASSLHSFAYVIVSLAAIVLNVLTM